MKQTTLIVILLLSGVSYSYAQKNDWTKFNLKGKVKTLKEVYTLDNTVQGRTVQSVSTISYVFNDAGYVTEKRMSYDNSRLPARIEIDTFNNRMNRMLPAENDESRTAYIYDEQGRLMREEEYRTPDMSIAVKLTEYSYDVNGKRVMALYYDPRQEQGAKEITRMSYDAQGRLAEKSISVADENTAFEEKEKEQYVYDDKGNVIEKMYYDHEKKKYWREYTAVYDAKGNAVEDKMYTPEGEIWQKKAVKRDAEGNITELVSEQYDGRKYTEKHMYANVDANGNYLKRVTLGEGRTVFGQNPVTTVERTIGYYK